jgi:hypothetical protein
MDTTTTTRKEAHVSNTTLSHEQFVQAVRTMAVEGALKRGSLTHDEAMRLMHTKLVYGVGQRGVRGTCHYGVWRNGIGNVDVVEVAAASQENWIQLSGTTVHELGHVLAGHGAGHSDAWKEACVRLGFTKKPAAAGQQYHLALLRADLREGALALAKTVADGMPQFGGERDNWMSILTALLGRPCSAGIGTRGGKSRGTGSGSRMRLYECACAKPVKVRVASDTFDATCNVCGSKFERQA